MPEPLHRWALGRKTDSPRWKGNPHAGVLGSCHGQGSSVLLWPDKPWSYSTRPGVPALATHLLGLPVFWMFEYWLLKPLSHLPDNVWVCCVSLSPTSLPQTQSHLPKMSSQYFWSSHLGSPFWAPIRTQQYRCEKCSNLSSFASLDLRSITTQQPEGPIRKCTDSALKTCFRYCLGMKLKFLNVASQASASLPACLCLLPAMLVHSHHAVLRFPSGP